MRERAFCEEGAAESGPYAGEPQLGFPGVARSEVRSERSLDRSETCR